MLSQLVAKYIYRYNSVIETEENETAVQAFCREQTSVNLESPQLSIRGAEITTWTDRGVDARQDENAASGFVIAEVSGAQLSECAYQTFSPDVPSRIIPQADYSSISNGRTDNHALKGNYKVPPITARSKERKKRHFFHYASGLQRF